MLYLLKNNNYYKVVFSENKETLKNRLSTYNIHNPSYKLIGIRHGDKTCEKEYHKLMNCGKTEWGVPDEHIIDKIVLDFNMPSYIASLFGETSEIYDGVIPEVYSQIDLKLFDIIENKFKIYNIILTDEEIFIIDRFKKYKVTNNLNLDIKTFYYPYDNNDEHYSGFCVNDVIFYSYSRKGDSYNYFGGYTQSSELYAKIYSNLKTRETLIIN